MELLFVQVVHEQFELYALNVYVSNYHQKKSLLPALDEWLLEVRTKKPDAILLVAGDFNCAYKPVKHLHELSLSDGQPTFRRVILGEVRQSRTDWVLCSHELTHETLYHWTEVSDHVVVESCLELPRSQPRATHITLPRKDRILAMCASAKEHAQDFSDFLMRLQGMASKKQHLIKNRVTFKQKKVLKAFV